MSDLPESMQQQTPKPSSGKTALWLAGVSVFIALFATTISMQSRFCASQQLKATSLTLTQQLQAQTIKMDALEKTLMQLQNSQQMAAQKRLAFVDYLVHLANLQLTIEHDQEAALSTLRVAQQQLATSSNSAFSALKEALSNNIGALTTLPVVHTHELFSQITAINSAIEKLSPIPAQSTTTAPITQENKQGDNNLPWYKQALQSVKQLKTLFVVRYTDQAIEPIASPNEIQNAKQAILFQLSMAQWALLHHDNATYQTTLKTVSAWLTRYFPLADAKNPIQNQLAALLKIQINPALPTLNDTLNILANIKTENTAKQIISPAPVAPKTPPAASVETQ
ncbi:MAG: uroporphyrinogen-III C-methyltransferase [Gammaproteobacteria bacterium]|nr:uroporphyrinogen-III C-methyltransferase [Gammaproteobacteria bacterium]